MLAALTVWGGHPIVPKSLGNYQPWSLHPDQIKTAPGMTHASRAAAARRPPARAGRARAPLLGPGGKKHCNCKNSRCLKLYCECFASGRYCEGCNCVLCNNNKESEAVRQAAVEAILERNPNAFRPKIQACAWAGAAGAI